MKADTPHPGAKRSRFARAAAVLVAAALAFVPAVAPAAVQTASAASHGPGYDQGLGWLGAYREGGQNVYCLEQPLNPPLNTTASYAGAWAWGALGPTNAARVNWAISTYGQSTDRRWTAAVQLYVWSLADPTYNTHGMSGDIYFVGRAPSSEQPLIRANLATIRAEANNIQAGSTTGSATGTFAVDALNNYAGTLTVSVSPSNMTGSITLTNGIFLSTGTNTIAGVTNGRVLQIKGVPTPDGEPYKISATGTFTGPFAYGGAIGVWATPGLQTLGGPGPQGAPVATLSASDPVFRVSDFVPELTSQVTHQVIQPGDRFVDEFVFSAVENEEAGHAVPWLQYDDGTYAPITASVTLYRTLSKPVPGDPIPADAVAVDTFTVTSSTTFGPGEPVIYESEPLNEGGYYVAVSTIRSSEQTPGVQAFIPLDYEWTDGWGVVEETAILMMPGTSQATPNAIAGLPASDTVFLPEFIPGGAWLDWEVYKRPEGGEVIVTFAAPDAAAAADEEPEDPQGIDPDARCTDATMIARFGMPITGRTMTSPDSFVFPEAGTYDWVAVVRDQEDGVELWRAPCGVNSERTVVKQVSIETQAQSSTTHDGTIFDVATLSGTVLEGDELTFRAYTPTYAADGSAVCEESNLLWTSAGEVIDAGVYENEKFSSGPTTAGTTRVWWVEELRHSDGELVHQGECGLASETSTRPGPPLAQTGADNAVPVFGIAAAGVVTLGLTLLVVGVLRSRRRATK